MTFDRVLITGGAGFIGTHLAERLAGATRVRLFDSFRRDSLALIPRLRAHPRVEVRAGDVTDPSSVAAALDGVDAVLHLAAIAGVSSYYDAPLDVLRVNLLGTVTLLEAAAARGVRRLVYFSTSEVFGPVAVDVTEDSLCHVGPPSDRRWVYATSKLAGEQFVLRTGEARGIAASVVRPFNVYGPRQVGEGAIANFLGAAVGGKPLTIYGDGSAIRAWCYVSDLVDAVARILDTPEAAGQVFNVGNPSAVETTIGLARRVMRLVPGTELRRQESGHADVRVRMPVIDKARRLLGYEPKVDLDEGLALTLASIREAATG